MKARDPKVFIRLHNGTPILCDLNTQSRYELDSEHYARIAELAAGAPFDAQTISIEYLAQILWSFGAIHGPKRQALKGMNLMSVGYRRSAPCAGSLQSCEAYVVCLRVEGLAAGVYHYQSETYELVCLDRPVDAMLLRGLLSGQMFAGNFVVRCIHHLPLRETMVEVSKIEGLSRCAIRHQGAIAKLSTQ